MKKTRIALLAGLMATTLVGCMTPTRAIDRVQVDATHPKSLGVKKIQALRDIGVAEARGGGWWYSPPTSNWGWSNNNQASFGSPVIGYRPSY